ncbi:YitT family protein [Variovorax sp. J22P168]|uniref:YitT family protein n=1 Tax=Variovorax jilinensis TaxID=3053513 RepID=UPI00257895B4|nr:YitT family protein [Variovorax sp. J22P168]MDM0012128.1 YitT family protein [Variovorax sp. J22P168]
MPAPRPDAVPVAAASSQAPLAHSAFEDALAMAIGTLFISFGVAMYTQAGLLTGGTAGLAFLLHYATGARFGWVFFVINLPFYYLAFRRMGLRFMTRTFVAVALVSLLSAVHPLFVPLQGVAPFYAAAMGGFIMGTGFVILFRHGASLGGINIVALYLQDRYGLRAGHLMLGIDLAILALAYFVVGAAALLPSVAGAVALNLVVALNHRKDRYVAM